MKNHTACFLFLSSLVLVSAPPAGAQATPAKAPRMVYVDRMDGMESLVEKALQAQELSFEFVEEAKSPDLKVTLKSKHGSYYGEILYREKLGRNEDHVLELYDFERKKVVASYSFKMSAEVAARERIAAEFAKRVGKAVKKVR